MTIETFIETKFPEGLDYLEAAQLCLLLYREGGIIPKYVLMAPSRENLAAAFSALAKRGWVRNCNGLLYSRHGASFHEVTDKGHWNEVMASIAKIENVIDTEISDFLRSVLTRAT